MFEANILAQTEEDLLGFLRIIATDNVDERFTTEAGQPAQMFCVPSQLLRPFLRTYLRLDHNHVRNRAIFYGFRFRRSIHFDHEIRTTVRIMVLQSNERSLRCDADVFLLSPSEQSDLFQPSKT